MVEGSRKCYRNIAVSFSSLVGHSNDNASCLAVLEELDRGKKNKTVRDAIRWMDITTETKDLDRIEIQRWKDMHQFDPELGKDWSRLSNTERYKSKIPYYEKATRN